MAATSSYYWVKHVRAPPCPGMTAHPSILYITLLVFMFWLQEFRGIRIEKLSSIFSWQDKMCSFRRAVRGSHYSLVNITTDLNRSTVKETRIEPDRVKGV